MGPHKSYSYHATQKVSNVIKMCYCEPSVDDELTIRLSGLYILVVLLNIINIGNKQHNWHCIGAGIENV